MESKTYEEWRQKGFCVKKGMKSLSRDKQGKALFTKDQVMNVEALVSGLSPTSIEYSGMSHDPLMRAVDMQMAVWGFIPTDMELWMEENDVVNEYPDAPEFEDHWMNFRPH